MVLFVNGENWIYFLFIVFERFLYSIEAIFFSPRQVIGAGRGVGREVAIQLSLLGVIVACVDINPENCEVTAQRACQLSGVARPYICDVTDQKQVKKKKRTIEHVDNLKTL